MSEQACWNIWNIGRERERERDRGREREGWMQKKKCYRRRNDEKLRHDKTTKQHHHHKIIVFFGEFWMMKQTVVKFSSCSRVSSLSFLYATLCFPSVYWQVTRQGKVVRVVFLLTVLFPVVNGFFLSEEFMHF